MSRLRTVAATYVDHQEAVRYPVELVIESCRRFDEHWLFGSDADHTMQLEALAGGDPRLHVACLHHTIRSSLDISAAMNLQVAHLRTRADFILLAQADTLATEATVDEVVRFGQDAANRKKALHFTTRDAQCYVEFWDGYGHTLIGADWPGSFHSDGGWAGPLEVRKQTCLHLGYLTPEACARHLRQHGQTYGEPPYSAGNHERRAQLFERDPDEFVRDRARWLYAKWRENPWSPDHLRMCGDADARYLAVIDRLDKRGEYEHVRAVVGAMTQADLLLPHLAQ
jgi:hypothetical protein